MPFVKRERKYYKYGTEPNATIVGSFARIDKGVASGITNANYLYIPETFTIGASDSFEIVASFTHKTQSSVGYIIGASTDATLGIIVNSNNTLKVNAGNGSSWYGDIFGTTVLTNGVKYWVKLVRDTSGWYLYISTDGKEYILENSNTWTGAPKSSNIYVGNVYGGKPFLGGSIDLSQSYININGERWWSGDSYTKVGSWIDDGVVSGTSASNYLEVANSFDVSGGKTWEMVYKVTTGSDVTTYQSICGHESTSSNYDPVSIAVTTSSKFALTVCNSSSSGLTEDLAGSHTVTANTTYFVKLFFDGSKYVLSYSLDGVDYTEDVSYTSSTSIWTSNLILGRQESSTSSMYPWLGSIDLTQSYIKINNKDWWHGTKAYQINVSGEDVWEKWEQPVLTSDGVLGGSSFAVSAGTFASGYDAYKAFDKNTTTAWCSNVTNTKDFIVFYNPKPLIVKNINCVNYNWITGGWEVYGSNDNVDYKLLASGTNTINTSGSSWNMDLSSNEETFKYYKINCLTTLANQRVGMGELKITAQQLMATGTIEDADYYVNHNKLYQLAAVKRSYWKYDYQDFVQPILTANGTMGGDKFAVAVDSRYDDYSAYKALDGDTSTSWQSNGTTAAGTYFKMYNPNPLNITKIVWSGTPKYGTITAGIVYGSNDDIDYVELATFSGGTTSSGTMDLSSNTNYYKYYKITPTTWTDNSGTHTNGWAELTITAQEQIVVEGTSSDYDVYTDKLLSYAPIVRGKRSYYKQAEKQQDTGTYTFTLDKDYTAKLLFVGNGGGGCSSQKDSRWHSSSGGSGACFEGLVRLPADTYTLTIGSLGYGNNANNTHYHSSSAVSTDSYLTNSAGQELIRVGAGGNGYTSVGGVGGAAGVLTLGTLDILETKKATDGVYTAGNVSTGSLSAYDNTYTGYGAGTGAERGEGNVYGIKGIFDLVLETDINNYTYYEDVGTKIY